MRIWFELYQNNNGKVLMSHHKEIASMLEVCDSLTLKDLNAQMEFIMRKRNYVMDFVIEKMQEQSNAIDPEVD